MYLHAVTYSSYLQYEKLMAGCWPVFFICMIMVVMGMGTILMGMGMGWNKFGKMLVGMKWGWE